MTKLSTSPGQVSHKTQKSQLSGTAVVAVVEVVGVVETEDPVEIAGVVVQLRLGRSLPVNPVTKVPSTLTFLPVSGGGARCISAGGSQPSSVRNP